MISVIIPIYNNEATLRRCVDSVLGQTMRDLEILLIDDGSKDGSGAIADSYCSDPRVRSFHKENGGLSSARNCGLDRMHGDYVAFVDADDWLEPDAFEKALLPGEDVCVFGCIYEYPRKTKPWRPVDAAEVIDSEEALRRLVVDGSIRQTVWTKLYRKHLFDEIRFPEGYCYEDIRTTHKVLRKADRIALIPEVLYHYVQYRNSIAHVCSPQNLLDRWVAYRMLYDEFESYGNAYRSACVRRCANAIFWAWGSQWKEKRRDEKLIREIVAFARQHRKDRQKHPLRLTLLLASTGTTGSMFIMHVMNVLYLRFRSEKLFDAHSRAA